MTLSESWSAGSLAKIAQLIGFANYLAPHMQQALSDAGDALVDAARANMNWQNPTGALEASMTKIVESPYELQVGSDLIYARRREFGFHGADSLGRMYDDVGAFFLSDAMVSEQDTILALLQNAIEATLEEGG